jgi:hypothetical protein
MGKPITRLNPKVESQCQRILFIRALELIIKIAMILPKIDSKKPGPKPYDYRIVLSLCIFRILLRKTYADYEIEMRQDMRICEILKIKILPGKSTLQRCLSSMKMDTLRQLNQILLGKWINRKLNISLDASGIQILGKSIWYSLRIKRTISKQDCDKIHLAICNDTMLILNWFMTRGTKNDSPFFRRLLKPFKFLGVILADKGYLSRVNYQFVYERNGSAFIPFKKNSTAKPKSCPAWKFAFNLWNLMPSIFKKIYNQRSRVECVFSALKKRWGDRLYSRKACLRRREMAMRFIAYNIRLIIFLEYSVEVGLSLWVRDR